MKRRGICAGSNARFCTLIVRTGLLIALLATLAPSWAIDARAANASLYVNEKQVLTLKSLANNGAKAAELANVISGLKSPPTVAVKAGAKSATIRLGARAFLSVTEAEASSHGSNFKDLASSWAANLKAAFALPPLVIEETELLVASDGTKLVKLTGTAARNAKVKVEDSDLVTSERVVGGAILRGRAIGNTSLTVEAGKEWRVVPIRVMPVAARFPQNLTATVTGFPAREESIRGAVAYAIQTQLKSVSASQFDFIVPAMKNLEPGQSASVTVFVTASALEAIPNRGPVQIQVRNEPLQRMQESQLWYSNAPENISNVGALFMARLEPDKPSRLLYHHLNATAFPIVLAAQVINTSERDARVLVIPGDSEPSENPVLAGLRAGEVFLRNWTGYSGEVLTIPPGKSLPLCLRRLAPRQTASGLAYLRLLGEGADSVVLKIEAQPSMNSEGRWGQALRSPTPWHVLGLWTYNPNRLELSEPSLQVFPAPFRTVDLDYEVGGKFGFARIGQVPILRADGEQQLQGNFGVSYTIESRLSNPLSEPAEVEYVFEASAGYSGALFVVEGKLIRTPLLQPKQEHRLFVVNLRSGERRNLTLQTVPLSGSSYPATLSVRPMRAAASR